MKRFLPGSILLFLIFCALYNIQNTKYFSPVSAQVPTPTPTTSDWYMAGANPQRTSWTPEEVRGQLRPVWYKPIEPYISQKVQIIAANNTLFISTSKGLYAIDSDTGAEKWTYPTELPLGNSPTYHETNLFGASHPKRIYVGGFDHKIHCLDAETGSLIWTYEATKGFETNPLVVEINNHLYMYAGNRDNYEYALEDVGTQANLLWKYQTQGPVLFSTAISSDNQTVYFASNDSYAYGLNALTGLLTWKSTKLPGAGFHSFWPVVYTDTQTSQEYVLFGGSSNYRTAIGPGPGGYIAGYDLGDIYPNRFSDPRDTFPGPQTADGAIDTSKATVTANGSTTPITEYFENKPWRRTYFILDAQNGREFTTDFDSDQKPEYAPILWAGTHSGNRYPAVVGVDHNLYQFNNYRSDPYIAGGQVSGWRFGTPYITTPNSDWQAVDEPMAFSGGGKLIYWNHCVDRSAGAFDVTIQNTAYPNEDRTREWKYYDYNLSAVIPGYNTEFEKYGRPGDPLNNVYGSHGDQNAPVPYKGKVYFHRSNAILAWGQNTGAVTALPLAKTVVAPPANFQQPTLSQLQQQLETEIQKIVTAGHLRPGHIGTGIFDSWARSGNSGDNLLDYWHDPSDTLYTLIVALPHLSLSLQQQVKTYLQSEFATYSSYSYTHIGWKDGAAREPFILPPEEEAGRATFVPTQWTSYDFTGWGQCYGGTNFPPHLLYVLWKYAQVFPADAKTIFDTSKNLLRPPMPDILSRCSPTLPEYKSAEVLAKSPFILNSYIAGYYGYLRLEELAGYPKSTAIENQLNTFVSQRVQTFTKDSPCGLYPDDQYCYILNDARNFIYLYPEVGQYLHDQALVKVQDAVSFYDTIAPFWFVALAEEHGGEGVLQPLYDVNALFQARALILKQPREELVKYLDVPAFERGDLFYIQNLVAAIEAPSSSTTTPTPTQGVPTGTPLPTPSPIPGDIDGSGQVGIVDLNMLLSLFGVRNTDGRYNPRADLDGSGGIGVIDLNGLLARFGR